MKKNYIYWKDNVAIDILIQSLRDANVIVGTTDTVLGLLADISEQGFHVLNRIKKRTDRRKPYIILIASKDELIRFSDAPFNFQIEKLISYCWPGPLTIIVKAKKSLPHFLKTENNTIALRVPQHDGLQRLLQRFSGLFSTSANMAGEKIPKSINELDEQILNEVSYLVLDSDEQWHHIATVPSTIIDCSGQYIKIVREGAYSIKFLKDLIGEQYIK